MSRVEVAIAELTVGMTVVDWWQCHRPQAPMPRVMKDVDADGFFALLAERVGRL
jgi:purine nucleosidase